MSSIAYYRLPHAERFIRLEQTQGEPEVLTRLTDLNGREGFVMAPFTIDAAHPIVLMHPDKVQEEKINDSDPCSCQRDGQLANAARQEERLAYGRDFRQFHQALKAERFDKLVLARCEEVERKCRKFVLSSLSMLSATGHRVGLHAHDWDLAHGYSRGIVVW